jgi:predicted HTH domain antitoxin
VIIELPEQDLGSLHLTSAQARVEVAVGLYAGKQVSLGRAAKIANLPKLLFLQEIGRRGICIHYGPEDLEHDLRVVDELMERAAAK